MRIAIGADHAGYELKESLSSFLSGGGDSVTDLGADGAEPSDYPDAAAPVARAVAARQADRGLLVCGSGIGMCIAANKVPGVRAALAWNEDIARLSREHNDANILCLPSRFVSEAAARGIVKVWLATPFSGEERHARRIAKVAAIEKQPAGPS